MKKIIKMALIRVGIKVNMLGFKYLCVGIELALAHPEMLEKVCKRLYPSIGEVCGVENSSSVERSIRTAIEDTFVNKSFLILNRMFKTEIFTINDKPTVSQLIKLMVEYIDMELYKDED